MAKSIVIAAFLLAATAGVAAYGQDNGLVAPELSKPTPGHLLDQDYQTLDRRDCPAARRSSGVGTDGARSQDPGRRQQDRQQHLQGVLT